MLQCNFSSFQNQSLDDATIGTGSSFMLLMEPIDGVEAGAVDDVSTPTVKKSVEKN